MAPSAATRLRRLLCRPGEHASLAKPCWWGRIAWECTEPGPALCPASLIREPMSITDRHVDRALLVLRVAVAIIFIRHGYAKLFVMGHEGVTGFFTQLGIPLPGLAAWGVAILEFFGGIALALGLFTRPLGLLFFFNMLGAIGFALLPKGFGAFELEFLLAAGSLALALSGAGALSVDAGIPSRKSV